MILLFKVSLRKTLSNRVQDVGHDRISGLGTKVTFAVNSYADRVRFDITLPEHKHGMNFHLLSAKNFAADLVRRKIELRSDPMPAHFLMNGFGIIHHGIFGAD